ncbi:hypothetical protein [Salipiger mangrovisoli]|uniref:PH domain-containing protein n=1 Tax=Salipiger mangrovisoli TaxID=2865933 RepID=A0ABR9X717_9RHOB|nr:hypothetical protein [Salipiger mangrovisoli]MBE9639388.1 hypothetical protein [Salipiger mangrovisoli]
MGTAETFEVKTRLLRMIGIGSGMAFLVMTPILVLADDALDARSAGLLPVTFFICLLCLVSCRVAKRVEVSDEAILIQPAGLRLERSQIESVRVMSKSALRPNEVLHKMKITTQEHSWRWIPFRLYWFAGKITIDLYWMKDPHGFARALGADLSDFTTTEPRRGG